MTSTEALIEFALDKAQPLQSFDRAEVSPDALRMHRAQGSNAPAAIDLQKRNLSEASLKAADLSLADLSGANLSNAACAGIKLNGARLEGACLKAADLVGADLSCVSAGEADFQDALLEDAVITDAKLRFANFNAAILDGADLSRADLWGARFRHTAAERVLFRGARLDESSMVEAELAGADFSGATLRRADLANSKLRNANLRDANLEGAVLAGADLTGALLPNVSLNTCDLRGASFSGAWLERTRMRAAQLQDGVGEELAGQLESAIDSYVVLERNFLSLGASGDARWAYLRKRRVARRLHGQITRVWFAKKSWKACARSGILWFSDAAAEWLCDYGESLYRVGRAFLTILFAFAALYWLTGSLTARVGASVSHSWQPINYLLFSLDSMTTVGTSEVALRPSGELGVLLSSLQTVMGTVLLGLFGFVLGARIRN